MIKYLSRLKAVSCIAIVFLHTFYSVAGYAGTLTEKSAAYSFRNLMMWAVPCFVMCSGALLLDEKRKVTMKKLFGTYICRMLITLIVFSLLFSLFDFALVQKNMSINFITDAFKNILYGTGWKHMWYIYLMIAIYLLLPIYRLVSKSASENEIKYMLAVYGFMISVLPLIENLLGKSIAFYICVYTIYPFYLFLGYAIHNGIIKLNKHFAAFLTIIFAVLTVILTFYGCKHYKSFLGGQLYNYSFPTIVIGSIGIYSLFKSGEKVELGVIDKFFAQIEKCSFGIYLIHMAILKYIFVVMKFNPIEKGGLFMTALISVVIFIISFVIAWILKKIPYVKKIV